MKSKTFIILIGTGLWFSFIKTKMGGKALRPFGSLRPAAACCVMGLWAAATQQPCERVAIMQGEDFGGRIQGMENWLRKLETRAALLEDARRVDSHHFHVLHSTQEFCVLVFGPCQENEQ
jgi:hypothetical protein